MGLRSNFSGMVASLEGGGFVPSPTHEVDERKLRAAERARNIITALDAVPVWARVVLGVAYRHADGEAKLIGALCSTNNEHKRSKSKRQLHDWLERQRLAKDSEKRRAYVRLREEARALLCRAVQVFGRVGLELARRRRLSREEDTGERAWTA